MESSRQRRILCVDDSKDNCELLQFILSKEGYQVEMAGHITEAVQLAQSLQFDLYMIELFFIDGSGFDLIHALRQFDASTPIVVCSGDGRDSVREAVRQVGVEIVLVKPIGVEMLVQVVAQVLDDRPLCS